MKTTVEIKAMLRSEISVYVKRRDAARKRFQQISKRTNSKLRTWRRYLKRIEEWENKIKSIDELVKEFTGVTSKSSIYAQSKNKILAKQLMCRYAMSVGISGKFIKEFIGGKGRWTVSHNRMRLIKRCQADKELNKTWHNFLNFVKEKSSTTKSKEKIDPTQFISHPQKLKSD